MTRLHPAAPMLSAVGHPLPHAADPSTRVVDTRRPRSVADLQRDLRALDTTAAAPAPVGQATGPEVRGRVDRAGADRGWVWGLPGRPLVVVVGAHPGAGCSTVALAVADAAAVEDPAHPVWLVETADPARSGLAPVADVELGREPDLGWRRGARGPVSVLRRAQPGGTPALLPAHAGAGLVVVDARHHPSAPDRGRTDLRGRDGGLRVVVVCHASVPGLARAEHLLAELTCQGLVCVVAAVGPARWPRLVRAARGPATTGHDRAGALVRVQLDPGLWVRGLSTDPLPKPVARAGRALLTHLPAIPDHGTDDADLTGLAGPRRGSRW